MVALGTETAWGKVAAVGCVSGERYYWLIDDDGTVSMMPTDVIEHDVSGAWIGETGEPWEDGHGNMF